MESHTHTHNPAAIHHLCEEMPTTRCALARLCCEATRTATEPRQQRMSASEPARRARAGSLVVFPGVGELLALL